MTTYSNDGFVWSCRADCSMVGPRATQTGVAWVGKLRYTQFTGAGVTLAQILKIARPIDLSVEANREFTLKQSVTNTNLIFENDAGD